MKPRKLLGITLDYSEGKDKTGKEEEYSKYPYFAVRQSYFDCLYKHAKEQNVTIVFLPLEQQAIDQYVEMLDGLMVIGGDDIPGHLFGEETHPKAIINKTRFNFDWELIKKYTATRKPFLGICAGMQILNVVQGGSIHQHLPDLGFNHSHGGAKIVHNVIVSKNSILEKITSAPDNIFGTNSGHHQAVNNVGKGLAVNAIAEDGIVEGIEMTSHPFCLGIQWHPEFELTEYDTKILRAFVKSV